MENFNIRRRKPVGIRTINMEDQNDKDVLDYINLIFVDKHFNSIDELSIEELKYCIKILVITRLIEQEESLK